MYAVHKHVELVLEGLLWVKYIHSSGILENMR